MSIQKHRVLKFFVLILEFALKFKRGFYVPHHDQSPMKAITLGSFFVLFAIVGGLTVPTAFAAEVSVPAGSGTPGCEDTDECWLPSVVTIGVGETVTWSNDDTAAHTVTSGNLSVDPNNVGVSLPSGFDSSLFMAGATFEVTFDEAGTFDYFCLVHPWMVGQVIVGGEGMMEGGDLTVTITDSASDDGVQVNLEFNQKHVNYDITATQDGNVVWQETEQHAHEDMMGSFMIPVAASDDNPIDIKIVSLGIGISEPFTGTMGEVASKQIVPEFGTTIAMMILGVAIVSIIAISAKSRVILKI